MRIVRLSMLGLAGGGAYALWSRFGRRSGPASRNNHTAADRRIIARAELTGEESTVGSDNPVAQAAAILAESDDRAFLPRDAEGVERRRSQDTVEL